MKLSGQAQLEYSEYMESLAIEAYRQPLGSTQWLTAIFVLQFLLL